MPNEFSRPEAQGEMGSSHTFLELSVTPPGSRALTARAAGGG